jgi:hypothetical protein
VNLVGVVLVPHLQVEVWIPTSAAKTQPGLWHCRNRFVLPQFMAALALRGTGR